jgi:hypothetical protein
MFIQRRRLSGAPFALALLTSLGCGAQSLTPATVTTGTTTNTGDGSSAPSLTALPLGDGKVSTSARVGYVYSCQTTFGGNAAAGSSPWIKGASWDLTAKPSVQGSVTWPNARITITRQGSQRVVTANNLPLHPTGIFPIQRTDPAFQYDGNPNSIREQNIVITLPAEPTQAASPSCVPQGMIGFTTSGAALYNALDAAGRDAAAHEVQDGCSGHPQMSGQYHYHSLSNCIADTSGAAGRHSDLIGYALDGYGIYGMHGENGEILSDADLDECHGHTHAIVWDGQTVVMYHYHMTREYPYSIGCFRGVR